MISQTHPHGHNRDKAKHAHTPGPGMQWHKDWRTWLVIGLMLAAIGTYVFTLDDAIQPGGAAPTAAVPANPAR